MLRDEIDPESVMQRPRSGVAAFCEQTLTAEKLRAELDAGALRRKDLCAFLDVGQSTLTDWFKSGRIPRMAAQAYVLYLVADLLAQRVELLQTEVDRANDIISTFEETRSLIALAYARLNRID